jgi:hypothetical protein
VCSGRCRAKRWRESRATRDPEIRTALEAIAQLVQVTLGRLEAEPGVVSLMLVILWPSVGSAIQLLPGETSGGVGVSGVFGHVGAGGSLSTPNGDALSFGFSQRGGPAALTFDAIIDPPSALACVQYPQLCGAPLFQRWQFDSGAGHIQPTPEPTTFLLIATTAAGLGLIRRCRRRGDGHAA